MRLYRLHFRQNLPIEIRKAWDFFSNPHNLRQITPPWLNFEITSDLPESMYAGMLITYQIRPVLGIANNWITEITHVREPYYFVDEQRFGPYKFWHHQHIFKEAASSVEMDDIVSYGLPFGLLGRIMSETLVRKKLEEIFIFRRQALERIFN
jgi:ligand-binding SRPBCC domain-containing protein